MCRFGRTISVYLYDTIFFSDLNTKILNIYKDSTRIKKLKGFLPQIITINTKESYSVSQVDSM